MCGTQERNWGPGSGGREPRGHSPGIWGSPQRPPQTEGVHASPSVPHEPTRGCLFLPKMLTATVSVTPGCPMRLHTKDEKIPLPGPPEGPLPRALCPRVSGSPRPQDNCGARPQAPHRPSPHPAPLGWKKLSKILSPRLVWQWGMWRYLSRRRCWTCPRAGSGLCCESATMGPAWAHGCPPGARAPECRLPPLGHLARWLLPGQSGWGTRWGLEVRGGLLPLMQEHVVLGLVWVCQGRGSSDGDPKCHWSSRQGGSDAVQSAQAFICQRYHFLCPQGIDPFRYILRLFGWSKNVRCHPIGPAWRDSFFWTSKQTAWVFSRGLHGPGASLATLGLRCPEHVTCQSCRCILNSLHHSGKSCTVLNYYSSFDFITLSYPTMYSFFVIFTNIASIKILPCTCV